MEFFGDNVAKAVLDNFDKLPRKRKPQVRSDHMREWIPLSGIVAQGLAPSLLKSAGAVKKLISSIGSDSLTCLAAATGMKCLPHNKIAQAQGVVLHDWHAEVLAIRSFNHFLLEECHDLALSKKQSSEFIRVRSQEERTESHFQPFALNDGINLHMYCSEAPCGDASMELTMAAQEDATPWDLPATSPQSILPSDSDVFTPISPSQAAPPLHGRGYFSALGLVRRKPSRPDAPPTLSKSCSDKIALKQCTSLLSSTTSLLVSPENAYIHTLVLPSSQLSKTTVRRAFSLEGRMAPLHGKDQDWRGGYSFKPFRVVGTQKEFTYSRRQSLASGEKLAPSNISAAWTNKWNETLIGGCLQGNRQFNVRGASRVCKRRLWRLALEISKAVGAPVIEKALGVRTYEDLKSDALLTKRRKVKEEARREALKGWIRNEGGEVFGVDGVEI